MTFAKIHIVFALGCLALPNSFALANSDCVGNSVEDEAAIERLEFYGASNQGCCSAVAKPALPACSAATAPADFMPDLSTLAVKQFFIDTLADGSKRLVFGNSITNYGVKATGSLQVQGRSGEGATQYSRCVKLSDGYWTVAATYGVQQLLNAKKPSAATAVVEECVASVMELHPTHGHFHMASVGRYELLPVLAGETDTALPADITTRTAVKAASKVSFCLIDVTKLTGAADRGYYTACNTGIQGISWGWADFYSRWLDDQWINGVQDGTYWFATTANPEGYFKESDRSNNTSYTFIKIRGSKVSIGKMYPASSSRIASGNKPVN